MKGRSIYADRELQLQRAKDANRDPLEVEFERRKRELNSKLHKISEARRHEVGTVRCGRHISSGAGVPRSALSHVDPVPIPIAPEDITRRPWRTNHPPNPYIVETSLFANAVADPSSMTGLSTSSMNSHYGPTLVSASGKLLYRVPSPQRRRETRSPSPGPGWLRAPSTPIGLPIHRPPNRNPGPGAYTVQSPFSQTVALSPKGKVTGVRPRSARR